jgi:hypothetical protein
LLPPCDSQVLLLTLLPLSWELSLDMLVAVQMIPTSAMIVTIPTITAMKTVALRVWRMYFCSTVSSTRTDVVREREQTSRSTCQRNQASGFRDLGPVAPGRRMPCMPPSSVLRRALRNDLKPGLDGCGCRVSESTGGSSGRAVLWAGLVLPGAAIGAKNITGPEPRSTVRAGSHPVSPPPR